MADNGLKTFFSNLRGAGSAFTGSLLRHPWPPRSDRERSQAIFQNFFLHIHSVRIHRHSLKPWFTMGLGLMSFFLFLLLCVSGIMLMFYYNPTTALAYNNVKDITFVVGAGRYMRNIHRWAAHGMVLVVLLHMVRVFYTGSYKRQRKFNWVIGMLLLAVTLMLSFTGYLLPWDQLAYWAITVGANIAASPRELTDAVGITAWFDIGGLIKEVLIGGTMVGQEALTRFYLLHVMILPLTCVILIGVHFWRIRKDGGLSRPDDEGEDPVGAPEAGKTYGLMELVKDDSPQLDRGPDNTVMSWPTAIWAEVAVFMLCLGGMMVLAYFFDAPLKELANPAIPENPAKAPWYFLGLQELVSYSAFMGGIGIPTVVVLGLMLIPYLDREEAGVGEWFTGPSGKRALGVSVVAGTIFTLALLAFTVRFGWLRDWIPQIPQIVITFINPGSAIVVAYALWSLFLLKRSGSTRDAAIGLFTCFLVGFIILTIMGVYFRGPNWDFYWSPAHWPGH